MDSITTVQTWTSTIRDTLERSECDIFTSRATTSGSRSSIWTRYVLAFLDCRKGRLVDFRSGIVVGRWRVMREGQKRDGGVYDDGRDWLDWQGRLVITDNAN